MRRVSVAAGRGSGTARAARAGGTRTSTSNTRVSRPWHRSQSSTPSFGWRNGWPWASASAPSLQAVHLPSVAIARSVCAPRAEPVGAEVPRRLPLDLDSRSPIQKRFMRSLIACRPPINSSSPSPIQTSAGKPERLPRGRVNGGAGKRRHTDRYRRWRTLSAFSEKACARRPLPWLNNLTE